MLDVASDSHIWSRLCQLIGPTELFRAALHLKGVQTPKISGIFQPPRVPLGVAQN